MSVCAGEDGDEFAHRDRKVSDASMAVVPVSEEAAACLEAGLVVPKAVVTASLTCAAFEQEVVASACLAVGNHGSGFLQRGVDVTAGEENPPAGCAHDCLIEGVDTGGDGLREQVLSGLPLGCVVGLNGPFDDVQGRDERERKAVCPLAGVGKRSVRLP
jgi:hypothetical protein